MNGEKAVRLGAVLLCLFLSMTIPVKFSKAIHMLGLFLSPILWMVDCIGDHPHWTLNPSSDTNDVKPPTLQSSGRGGWGKISAKFKRRRPGKKVSATTNIRLSQYVNPFKRTMHSTSRLQHLEDFQACLWLHLSFLQHYTRLRGSVHLRFSQSIESIDVGRHHFDQLRRHCLALRVASLGYPQRIHCIPKCATLQTW